MAELLGCKPELLVMGMEPLSISDWSMELSEPVRTAYPLFLRSRAPKSEPCSDTLTPPGPSRSDALKPAAP